jgi:hypothetical protein
MLKWVGHVARMGEMRSTYRTVFGEPDGKRPLRRPRHIWEDNIRMVVMEIVWGDVDWIDLTQHKNRWLVRSRNMQETS